MRDYEDFFGYDRGWVYEREKSYEEDLYPCSVDFHENGLFVSANLEDMEKARGWTEGEENKSEEEVEKMYPDFDRFFFFDKPFEAPKLEEGDILYIKISTDEDKFLNEIMGTEIYITLYTLNCGDEKIGEQVRKIIKVTHYLTD